ncbi:hypothetical protein GOBAR_DD34340 [Gossypium barbadense]|nr:hypothetical protein GOBAR_DD34340 [Gossypium barbadense]
MGGLCSRRSTVDNAPSGGFPHVNGHIGQRTGLVFQTRELPAKINAKSNPPPAEDNADKVSGEPFSFPEISTAPYGTSADDINDGIPRLSRVLSDKSRSTKSKQVTAAKDIDAEGVDQLQKDVKVYILEEMGLGGYLFVVNCSCSLESIIAHCSLGVLLSGKQQKCLKGKVSEVGSLLGRAGTAGLGKAVEVLDTLGSSMTNLNLSSGFTSGVTTKGNKIAILAFEVANTIVKGANLMQSLSNENIRHLKEVVLPSEGVQNLISRDMDELLRIAAADKREELKVFSGEVVRFGNRCKDPQWHNLDRYFEKLGSELTPEKQLKDEAEAIMQQLMSYVQYTAVSISSYDYSEKAALRSCSYVNQSCNMFNTVEALE